jgi:hypothetical protein
VTRAQKLILVALTLVNLLVIGGLATTVISQGRGAGMVASPSPGETALPDTPTAPSPCAEHLITSLQWLGGTTRVSSPGDELLVEVTFGPSGLTASNVPDASPQALWSLLDSLSPAFTQACGTPEWVTLTARFRDAAPPEVFTVRLAGPHLVSWLVGGLDDAGLVAEARYRGSKP